MILRPVVARAIANATTLAFHRKMTAPFQHDDGTCQLPRDETASKKPLPNAYGVRQPMHEPAVYVDDTLIVQHLLRQSRDEGANIEQGCAHQHSKGHGVLQPEASATCQERHLSSHTNMIAEEQRKHTRACLKKLSR